MKPPSYLIVGCGRVGSRAARKIVQEQSRARVTLVDRNPGAFEAAALKPAEMIEGEALPVLGRLLSSGQTYDYIIPAVPFHLAFEFALSKLAPRGMRRAAVPALPSLPNATRGKTGDVYVTFANFICPEDCPEPPLCCTVTRQKREVALYELLANLTGPFESKVIRSEQLAAGIGGYRPGALLDLVDRLEREKVRGHLVLISTACRCHGVISALSS